MNASLNDDSIQKNVMKQELEEMVALAEESTRNIDRLVDMRERMALQFLAYTGMACAVSATSCFGFYWFTKKDFWGSTSVAIAIIIGAALGSIASVVLILVAIARFGRMKRIRRDERAERHIQHRLISLIDEQARRVRQEGQLSSIAAATLEIRLRRLDRSDHKE